jgi:Fic-DOC domain mobile mystery protein B
MNGPQPDGATHLTPAEEEGLIPSHVTMRSELNSLEQANILQAESWLLTRRRKPDPLDPAFLRELHRRMFGDVWKWAGIYRKSDRNIGIHWPKISIELETLCRDAAFWKSESVYPPDELAVRFHHRLVSIHCYPNGNGRHARLASDLLMMSLGGRRFTWGGSSLEAPTDVRRTYIDALRKADGCDPGDLLKFARS